MASKPQSTVTADGADGPMIQPLCAVFRRFLKDQGLKYTPERAQILSSVINKPGVFEPEALAHEMYEEGHRVSKATIYRTLKHLKEANIISEVLIDSKQARYRLSIGREPTGFLVCLETNAIHEFSAPELDALRDRICAEHGYDPVSYRFVVYGLSPEARDDDAEEA